jgi:regulatory protein
MSDSAEAAHEAALKALERRRRTRRELERRLAERDFAPAAVRVALDRLERVGLVDDLEYARAFLRERLGRRAVGARAVRSELLRRGVPAALIDQALAETAAGGETELPRTELERARRALAQITRRYAGLEPRVRRQRLAAALARRGFDYETVAEALAEPRGESGGAEDDR